MTGLYFMLYDENTDGKICSVLALEIILQWNVQDKYISFI